MRIGPLGGWHSHFEERREEEKKAKAKPNYIKEIKVLVDLLEDDTLTKEVFIKKIKEKLK